LEFENLFEVKDKLEELLEILLNMCVIGFGNLIVGFLDNNIVGRRCCCWDILGLNK